MRLWKFVVLLGTIVTLTGCVSLTPPTRKAGQFHPLSWEKRQSQIREQRSFSIKGAFSITERGEKPVLANYQWVQNTAKVYRIRVSSALNLYDITIFGRPRRVTLWKGAKKRITASSPEALLKNEMGWTLPIQNLFYWIRGIAAPGIKRMTTNQYGHLTLLRQNGWVIQFSHYTPVKGYDLPEKIFLQRSDVKITIVIKRWILTS